MPKHDIFISYRRAGGSDVARNILLALEKRGYSVFMDVEDLKTGPFDTALFSKIDGAKDFLVIMSEGCLDRCNDPNDWLRLEIRHALQKGKNIVPIMTAKFHWPTIDRIPEDIRPLSTYNGLPPSHEYFEQSVDKLAGYLSSKPKKGNLFATYAAAGIAVLALFGLIFALPRLAVPDVGDVPSAGNVNPGSSKRSRSAPIPTNPDPSPPRDPGKPAEEAASNAGAVTQTPPKLDQASADQLLVGLWAPDGNLSNHLKGNVTPDAVRDALARGANPDARSSGFNETTLGYAAHNGLQQVAKILIDAGANVDDAGDNNGYTPLMDAACADQMAIAQLLMDSGAKVDFTNSKGQTALMIAAQFCRPEIVRFLLAKGASVNIVDSNQTNALYYAQHPQPYYDRAPSADAQEATIDALRQAG